MSAECWKCGADIVYPEGTWPVGRCQVCDLRAQMETLREALRELVEAITAWLLSASSRPPAADVLIRAQDALTQARAALEGEPDER